ncbi:MAG: DUF427 domain-containing protein [Planctomycetota bacterium]
MARAIYNGQVIAESDQTEVVEGNHYFPKESVKTEFLRDSEVKTTCPWKGEASYYDVAVGDDVAEYAAWYYPDAKDAAKSFEGYVAFWRGVTVEA